MGVSPSAGNKIKEWPSERFAKVADHLIEKHQANIIIIGGPEDKRRVAKTKNHMKFGMKALEVTNFSIDELKALISKLGLFISVDTGPIYIAEAFGIPTIDIVGPMDEKEQPPIGVIHKVVVPVRTKPQLHIMNARAYDAAEALQQTLSITVLAVTEEIDKLMRDLSESKKD